MSTNFVSGFAVVLALCSPVPAGNDPPEDSPRAKSLEVFEQRIMPIFKSPQPASCVQCHLAAVDLKDYILPSHEQTFASLRDQGLVDLAEPGKSKILELIRMGDRDPDEGARRLHAETRRAEYEAFAAWIEACCRDPRLRAMPKQPLAELARPERSDEVIRHSRKSRVLDSFVRNVWSQRMRCFPCHTPHELDDANPRHKVAIDRHQKLLDGFGSRLEIFRETPEATLDALVEKSREVAPGSLPLLNLRDPKRSLLVLKPTSKLPPRNEDGGFEPPSSSDPVSHMGGLKMHVDDASYKSFMAWIQDYARVVGNEYATVDDLPADNWHPTHRVVFVQDVPADWPVGTRVQIFVHAWNGDTGSWRPAPAAFTQGQVAPRRNVAGTLFLLGPTAASDTEHEPADFRLAPGRYLLKAYVDAGNRLSDDPVLLLGSEDFRGQAEIEARWEEGFPKAERIAGSAFE